MKRLLVLTAMAALLPALSGCWHWCNRGQQCNSCGAPAAPACGDAYMGAPSASMAPPAYATPFPQ